MDESMIWLLVFGVFVTAIFVLGVYYTISEFGIMKEHEPEQRKEHDDTQGAKIDEGNQDSR